MTHLAVQLRDGAAAMGLVLPDGTTDKLLAYLALMAKWNRTYNLTAIRDEGEMLTHHVLDSLAILPAIEKSVALARCGPDLSLADVGSGAGLPGLVLAMARPAWQVTSVESNQKKAAFQQQAKIELGLGNVNIRCARVEAVADGFVATVSRAFASLADFVRLAGHLSSLLLAMKGHYPEDEVAALPPGWRVAERHELKVPGLAAQRHLLILEKT